jgi:hypothetical protein
VASRTYESIGACDRFSNEIFAVAAEKLRKVLKPDAAGFNMVGPEPRLHPGDGTENYFYFVHPSSLK